MVVAPWDSASGIMPALSTVSRYSLLPRGGQHADAAHGPLDKCECAEEGDGRESGCESVPEVCASASVSEVGDVSPTAKDEEDVEAHSPS